jgi:hypothetical protein
MSLVVNAREHMLLIREENLLSVCFESISKNGNPPGL